MYPTRVDGRLNEELLLLATGKVDRLSDERIDLIVIVISSELDVWLVILLEER